MPIPMTIRPATVADLPTIVDFNARMALETEHKTLDRDVLARGCAAVLSSSDKGFYTVVERDGTVVGQCLMTFEWSDWRDGWFWWIQSVYVAESTRRQGVWKALYRHLLDRAANDPSVIGIRLYVERANATARSTYEAMGMHDAGYDIMEHHPLPGRPRLS
jgi:ribosomal protein S18 acetylase RimI-like enzyme